MTAAPSRRVRCWTPSKATPTSGHDSGRSPRSRPAGWHKQYSDRPRDRHRIEVVFDDVRHANVDIPDEGESVIALLSDLIERGLSRIARLSEPRQPIHIGAVIGQSEFFDRKCETELPPDADGLGSAFFRVLP